jgi:hypothetical protein
MLLLYVFCIALAALGVLLMADGLAHLFGRTG